MTNDLYIQYFLHQAIHHPLLRHHAENNEVFEIIDVQEAIGDFRSSKSDDLIYMRLINYSGKLEDNGGGETLMKTSGGIQIMKHHSDRSDTSDHYKEVMTTTQQICNDIMAKIKKDSIAGHPLWYYSMNTLDTVNFQPAHSSKSSGYSGWIYTWQWSGSFNHCVSPDLDWGDNGVTPHEL